MNQIIKHKKQSNISILKRQRSQLKLQVSFMKRSKIFTEEEKNHLGACYKELIQLMNQKINDKKNYENTETRN